MTRSVKELLERNLIGVFGERDALRRKANLAELWLPDGVFIDPDGRFVGLESIDRCVAELQARFPGFVFSARGPADVMHGVGRLPWAFGPAGAAPVVTGVDVGVARDGWLEALYAFIDA